MTNHPGDEDLLRLADDDLTAGEAAKMGGHISVCAECRERLESVGEALDGYQRFHDTVLKKSLGRPPRPWAAVRKRAVVRFPVKRMLAAAAMVTLVFGVVRRLERTPAVKASELLRRAVQAEQSAPTPAGRIRIRTRRSTLVRAARIERVGDVPADPAGIRVIFDAAGYSWDDPLSALAFVRWRDGLKQKKDRVTSAEGSFVVSTSTSEGSLAEARLTLRAGDLHAVSGTLEFRSAETVEMTELTDDATAGAPPRQTAPLARPESARPAVPAAPPQLGPGDELHVIAALHRIGADLGEPVEVRREGGAVLVSSVGLTPERQEQVRAALSQIPGVEVRFEEARGRNHAAEEPQRAASRPNTPIPNPLITELHAKLGGNTEELSERLIDANDRAVERAYALRALARRFPRTTERELSTADRRVLAAIVSDHLTTLAQATVELRRLLEPILPQGTPLEGHQTPPEWQVEAETILVSAQSLDQMLGGAAPADSERVAEELARLNAQMAAIQELLR